MIGVRLVESTDRDIKMIPVIYNIHDSLWNNIDGTKVFYKPVYNFNDNFTEHINGNSPFSFNIDSLSKNGNVSNLKATIKLTVKKEPPAIASSNMSEIPSTEMSDLFIPYFYTANKLTQEVINLSMTSQDNNNVTLYAHLEGESVLRCYGTISGMEEGLPTPPFFSIGIAETLALVPLSLTNLDLDNPDLSNYLHEVGSQDLTQYRLCLISGFELQALRLSFPCKTMGNLYTYTEDNGNKIVLGCRIPEKIKFINPNNEYVEIYELNKPNYYRVFRKRNDKDRYLILPDTYKIEFTTYEDGDENVIKPDIYIQASIETSTPFNSTFLFQISLAPDISLYHRNLLENKIITFSSQAIIEYPSHLNFNQSIKIQDIESISSHRYSVSYKLTIPLSIERALLLKDAIINHGAFGSIHLESESGVTFDSSIDLNLQHIVGPWNNEPIELIIENNKVELINKSEYKIQINSLLIKYNSNILYDMPIKVILAPLSVSAPPTSLELPSNINQQILNIYPDYILIDRQQEIPVYNSYIEKVTVKMEFLDLINHQSYLINDLKVNIRKKGDNEIYNIPLAGEPKSGNIELDFSLGNYYRKSIIEVQLIAIMKSEEIKTSNWLEWNISLKGNIISLIWDSFEWV